MFRPPIAPILVLTLASFSCDPTSRVAIVDEPVVVSEAPPVALEARPVAASPTSDASEHVPAEHVLVGSIADYLSPRATWIDRNQILQIAETIVREARPRDLEPWLVVAVMEVESAFDTFAVSDAGAFGLMQIQLPTGEELADRHGVPWQGTTTLFDPVANTRLGIAYLDQLRDRFGDLRTALAAYNWGPGHIRRRIQRGRPVPAGYSKRVLDSYSNAFDSRHRTS